MLAVNTYNSLQQTGKESWNTCFKPCLPLIVWVKLCFWAWSGGLEHPVADKPLCCIIILGEWYSSTMRLYWFKLINPLTEEGDSGALAWLK